MKVNREFKDHTDHSGNSSMVDYQQALSEIAYAYTNKDNAIEWSNVEEPETDNDYGRIYYSITVKEEDSTTIYSWSESL